MNNEDMIIRTAREHADALARGEYSARDLALACLDRAESLTDSGIFLRIGRERVIAQAEAADRRRAQDMTLGPLDGIPITVKDNICETGEFTTCASKILENFFAPYDATVIEKLRAGGAVLLGRTNMDEFAMGSSNENSAFGPVKNPWDAAYVPGGSSGGSAAAVAASCVPLALGSDTGGSIRQPAAFCGVVGLKPTYGRVSRYGLVAFASSLDQIGPFARTVEDAAALLALLSGHDSRDATSHPEADRRKIEPRPRELSGQDWRKVRVGVELPEAGAAGFDPDVIRATERARDWLAAQGAEIVPLQSRFRDYLIPIYYILATAEASSNLSRYDGIRYGRRAAGQTDLVDLYIRSRTEGFGPEVKRRILLGTFVLSSGYYDAYYNSAQKARKLIQREFDGFFQKVDVILSPTSPTTAFKLGERTRDPLAMYQSDILTTAANLGGIPAISIPGGLDGKGLPIGIQLMADHFEENRLLEIAAGLARSPGLDPGLPLVKTAAPPKTSKRAPVLVGSGRSDAAGKAPAAAKSPVAAQPVAEQAQQAAKKKPARVASPVKKKAPSPTKKKPAKKKAVAKKAKKKAVRVVKKKTAKKKTAAKKAKKKIARVTKKKKAASKKAKKKTARLSKKRAAKKVARRRKK